MRRYKFGPKLKKMSFHGEGRNCDWTRISEKGIEVDRAKIKIIEKLPPPTNMRGVRSFLGHAEFYR